ncbi:nucleotidyl transferase AbiEii/AbiGii toxin family protein [Bradyrhizobium ottawaense]|uniref:Nucleotidyl transferase AbiEii/AbiGii toxin family protein n=1 Tax=Bradyrhizobium barranii subsp. barranii TaxID=2823807 RepID=A0A9X9YCW0_9BRAD|nr:MULTISPECIES: nucleotidyl transferase AbiEii/AbiGii toxin family protein [Bradyrhizobium]UEM17754.1 nucleotidyl transferase AbiEii/AbiGii toxin family protein [Bradyrhizobium barranii subsp. barranii]MCD9112307.1 nucleotidyl transferase AbiEii/AbiGii toxin family protein [Bradyrhizobium japonicum]MCD9258203.1 nucleotidyl transferase AbiEii/AbiGii toxin family protein [Bradyrhizobium japonicum SEMIA 5079]MCD9897235.1 nucleotidyl transferase AbiEii/AbiGii toxin family protein [Bradyrhizobium j
MPERARRHWARISSPSGTSLSKAYGAIRRFSYDVDLTYGIRATAPDPWTIWSLRTAVKAKVPTRENASGLRQGKDVVRHQ